MNRKKATQTSKAMVFMYNQKGNNGENETKMVGRCCELTKQKWEAVGVLGEGEVAGNGLL